MYGLSHTRIADAGKCFILKNAACIITMNGPDDDAEKCMGIKRNCDIVIRDGRIEKLNEHATHSCTFTEAEFIDASAWVIMPGLVDAHAHPLCVGSRASETVLKAKGLGYEEIAARGGGIVSSMKKIREASDIEIEENFVRFAQMALARGVVCMDAKTGYGLNISEEMRHFQCLIRACEQNKILPRIAATLLGPHAASPDFQGMEAFIGALINSLPQFAEVAHSAVSKGILTGVAADIFVERNYFTKEQGEKWLNAALSHGLDIHVHADEFSRSGGSEIAISLAERQEQTKRRRREKARVLSVDHCQYANDADLKKLAERNVTAVALPTTSFFSNIPYIDAAKWRNSGVRTAIATDFNPGSSPSNSLWFAAYLALTKCGFSMPEVYAGVTKNAAYALGVENTFGVLKEGGAANLVAFRGNTPEDFFASPLGDHVTFVVRS